VRVVFMGSPDFAVPALEALVEARCDVPLVVTRPDKATGRGRRLRPTAVREAARRLDLPVRTWGRGEAAAVTAAVADARPDAVVVVAFGRILREPLLSLPPLGCINLHASLLPRWRGVAPVHYALLHGDTWTGVSIMRMDAGVDTGPVLAERAVPIDPEETAGELLERLAGIGADLLVATLRRLENGQVTPRPQDEAGAVYAPKLSRDLSPLRWDRPVVAVHNQVRALQPWPGAVTYLEERQLKVTASRPASLITTGAAPGTVLAADTRGLEVACGEGSLLVTGLQLPGRKPLPVDAFLRGFPIAPGAVLRS